MRVVRPHRASVRWPAASSPRNHTNRAVLTGAPRHGGWVALEDARRHLSRMPDAGVLRDRLVALSAAVSEVGNPIRIPVRWR